MAEPGSPEGPSLESQAPSPVQAEPTVPDLSAYAVPEATLNASNSFRDKLLFQARKVISALSGRPRPANEANLIGVKRAEPVAVEDKGTFFPADTPDGGEISAAQIKNPRWVSQHRPLPTPEAPVLSNNIITPKAKVEDQPPTSTRLFGDPPPMPAQ